MKVVQKDGSIDEFDEKKVADSIFKETSLDVSACFSVARYVKKKLKKSKTRLVTGPLIREAVCMALLHCGYESARYQYTRVGMPLYDAISFDGGAGTGDNANLHLSPETIHKRKADRLAKEQALLQMPKEIANMHLSGDIHIHDLEYFTTRPFCFDHDLRFTFYYGLVCDGTGEHTSVAGPAMRPEVAIMHAAKVLGASQTNCAGGQGFYNFLCFLAPYFNGADYKTYKQCMQMFVYEMTQMLVARGGQVVFSSVQLAPGIPKLWRDIPVVSHGNRWEGTVNMLQVYGDFELENRLLFKALMEVMIEGDSSGKPFYFPKPEINIAPEFLNEEYDDLYDLAFELAAKFGTPYFDNTTPKYRQNGGVECYQCCAYNFSANSDTDSSFDDKLWFIDGQHFSMGSWQVITLNLPRLAYKARDADDFIDRAQKLINSCISIFRYKRECMQKMIDNHSLGFLQQRMTSKYGNTSPIYADFDSLVYTIGVIGLNEVVTILSGNGIETDEGSRLALKICAELKKHCKMMSEFLGSTIAFARTPAETTGQRFAYLDFKAGYDVICQGDKEEAFKLQEMGISDVPIYYTNGTHVPPAANVMPSERLRIEQSFFPVLDGGNITHIWLGEQSPSVGGLKDMAMKICKTNCGYFSFTRDFTTRTRFYRLYKQ